MKKRRINITTCCLALLLLGSCIHEYPEQTGATPATVELELEVVLDEELLPLPEEARTRTVPTGYERRFIIDVYHEGKVMEEKRITATQGGTHGGKFTLPVPLKLNPLKYTLVAWVDYVEAGTNEDLSFETTDLGNVASIHPYPGGSHLREAFYGTTELDLTSYGDARDTRNIRMACTVNMQRTHAHFRIIATDADEFREILARRSITTRQPQEYQVRVLYEFYFPTAFDAVAGVPCASDTGVEFTSSLTLQSVCGSECELVADYIPAGETPSFITLTLELTDDTGKLLSRAQGVQVPYKRGCTTTVSGRFLTTMMSGGIDFDAGYEGEFNVDISDFIK